MEKNKELSKAFKLGFVCVFSYIACYYMRNLLGVATPLMVETGFYTKEFLGTVSSAYMLAYAIGQLINGIVGDRINPKYMVSIGLFVSGVASVLFPVLPSRPLQLISFIVLGFSLSMLRGPLVKIISENTLPKYAQTICVFFSCSGFIGPLVASFLAIIFKWDMVFFVAGVSVMVIGVAAYFVLTVLEKKGIIVVNRFKSRAVDEKYDKKFNLKSIFKVFALENFFFYMIVGALVEVSAASINFWIPTYMNEHLGFTPEISGVIFSAISFLRALCPFIALAIFRLIKNKEYKMIFFTFLIAFIMFITLIFVTNKYLNVLVLLIALMAISCASALLWSIYIPSQGKTGLVSTVNGVLDFSGYAFSFAANLVFTYSVSTVGWTGIILIWAGLMVIGVVAPVVQMIRKRKTC